MLRKRCWLVLLLQQRYRTHSLPGIATSCQQEHPRHTLIFFFAQFMQLCRQPAHFQETWHDWWRLYNLDEDESIELAQTRWLPQIQKVLWGDAGCQWCFWEERTADVWLHQQCALWGWQAGPCPGNQSLPWPDARKVSKIRPSQCLCKQIVLII